MAGQGTCEMRPASPTHRHPCGDEQKVAEAVQIHRNRRLYVPSPHQRDNDALRPPAHLRGGSGGTVTMLHHRRRDRALWRVTV